MTPYRELSLAGMRQEISQKGSQWDSWHEDSRHHCWLWDVGAYAQCTEDWLVGARYRPSWQPGWKQGPQSYNYKEMDSDNNLHESGSKFFPRGQPGWHLDFGFVRAGTEKLAKLNKISDLYNSEIIILYSFKPLSLWWFFMAAMKK